MAHERKWTKEAIEAYLASHPNATLKEMTQSMGVSKQRVSRILNSLHIKLPGTTEKVPAKKANPHSQPSDIPQNLAQPTGKGKLIVMTPCTNGQLVQAIRNGATAYLARELAMEEARQSAGIGNFMQVSALKDRLTKREIEILRHLANGKTHAQTAEALGIHRATVKNHMTTIMRKLGANNKAHATALALQYGLLSLHEISPGRPILPQKKGNWELNIG